MILAARIIEERKNYYIADTGAVSVPVVLKGILKKEHKRLLAGDFVDIEIFESEFGSEGIIRKLHPRRNELYKPAIANIDRVFLIVAIREPVLEPDYIDRFLFYLESRSVPAVIVFNKMDLAEKSSDDAYIYVTSYYESIGYPILKVSARECIGIESILTIAKSGVSIFAGPSGAGKSTLLSRIFPHIIFETNELSKNIMRGVNTTTFTTLLRYDVAFIADTPGFSYLEAPDLDEERVSSCFVEFADHAKHCRFSNCMHINEPECGVKDAVSRLVIAPFRYESYKNIYNEVKINRLNKRDRGARRIVRQR